ncbi:MAG: hypothetical protein V2I40_04050, partial [Desulfobacteraceae bacterium]|nr:hypothetical protein [Desulfobacteraceae bacterium]
KYLPEIGVTVSMVGRDRSMRAGVFRDSGGGRGGKDGPRQKMTVWCTTGMGGKIGFSFRGTRGRRFKRDHHQT